MLAFFADLYKIAHQDFWGYVTSGGTEGNFYGIFLGREVYPQGILYSSQASHYSIAKAAKLFRMTHLIVDSQVNGELDYERFEQLICANRDYPAIINLNTGTTVKGAIDNLDVVLEILTRNNIKEYYKWQLAVLDDWAHIIVMQNITKQKIDAFLAELDFALRLQVG